MMDALTEALATTAALAAMLMVPVALEQVFTRPRERELDSMGNPRNRRIRK